MEPYKMKHGQFCRQAVAAAVLGVLGVLGAATAQAVPVLSLAVNPNPVAPGGNVQVNVLISGAVDLYAYQFSLLFNPAVLQASAPTEGAFLPTGGTTFYVPGTVNNTLGSVNLTIGSLLGALPGVNGDGVLASLSFNATAVGSSVLQFADVVLLDSDLLDIQAQTQAVTVSVIPEPGTWLMFGLGLAAVGGLVRRRMPA
jgi:hypothetical protein